MSRFFSHTHNSLNHLNTILMVMFMFNIKNIRAFFIIAILGTLGHFIYEISGKNLIAGLFFSVNESTWEHLKLLFWPTLIYSAAEYFICKQKGTNYISATIISLFCGMLSIVALFYTYTGVLGKTVDFINIGIYYLSIIIMLRKKSKLLQTNKFSSDILKALLLTLVLITALLFFFYSYNPPSLGIFKIPNI